jgi:hypothetical protein
MPRETWKRDERIDCSSLLPRGDKREAGRAAPTLKKFLKGEKTAAESVPRNERDRASRRSALGKTC